MLDTVHVQKLLSLRQRSDNLRWQMTYERQQSRRQQTCRTCFCIVAFDISERILHLEPTSPPSPEQNAEQGMPAQPPGSARRRYLNNSKQDSLGISSPNGYSSMVLCTDKLAACLGAVRMQRLLRCAASKTHARSHYIVPWRLIVKACLSSQSKYNPHIPEWSCLCGWSLFNPYLANTGCLEGMIDHISFPLLWEGYHTLWGFTGEFGLRCFSECLRNLKPEDAITAGFFLWGFSRQGWRTLETNLHVTCRSCPFTWELKLAEEAMLECFCPCGICPGGTQPLPSPGLQLDSENSLDSW